MAKKSLESIKEKTDLRALRRNDAIRKAADWVFEHSTINEKQARTALLPPSRPDGGFLLPRLSPIPHRTNRFCDLNTLTGPGPAGIIEEKELTSIHFLRQVIQGGQEMELYRVIQIGEADYGCEELPEGAPVLCQVLPGGA